VPSPLSSSKIGAFSNYDMWSLFTYGGAKVYSDQLKVYSSTTKASFFLNLIACPMHCIAALDRI